MRVVNVAKKGNRIDYYECIDNMGRRANLSKSQLIKEIQAGRCENAKLQIYYGSYIIRVDKDIPKSDVTNSQKGNLYSNYNKALQEQNRPSSITVGDEAVNKLIHMEIGTPLKVKTGYSDFIQAIFMGIKDIQSCESFVFFTDEGLTGAFGLSAKFIRNNTEQVQFKFNDNDPVEVARLLEIIKSRRG